MKRARWAFILISLGFGMIGGIFSGDPGWLGIVGVAFVWASGFTIASAWGINIPKSMSDRWPDLYPSGESK